MRFHMFAPQGGHAYGSLVCSVCNKNVTFELEPQADLSTHGHGAKVLHMLGAPKPPNVERKKSDADPATNDKTL
jgi:hypothetical protein